MNIKKLEEMGLNSTQINQVVAEHNRSKQSTSGIVSSEKLEAQLKRDEIMSIEDTSIRQELIAKNSDLFKR